MVYHANKKHPHYIKGRTCASCVKQTFEMKEGWSTVEVMIPIHINGIGEVGVPVEAIVCVNCHRDMHKSLVENLNKYHKEA